MQRVAGEKRLGIPWGLDEMTKWRQEKMMSWGQQSGACGQIQPTATL
jgi:hypothetical protein